VPAQTAQRILNWLNHKKPIVHTSKLVGGLEKEKIMFPNRKKTIFKNRLFMRLFVLWYNFIRPQQTLKRPPAAPITSTCILNEAAPLFSGNP